MVGFFLLLHSLVTLAQNNADAYNLEVQHWGVEEGLSHRRVQSIFQDSRGFMWLGTGKGLNRFDGYEFRVFTKEADGLPSDDINYLVEDAEGWLWVSTNPLPDNEEVLNFINTQTLEILSVAERFGKRFPFEPKHFTGIATNAEGTVFLAGGKEVYQYKNKQFSLLKTFENGVILHGFNDTTQTLLGHERISYNSFNLFELNGSSIESQAPFEVYKNMILAFYDQAGNCWVKADENFQRRSQGSNEWQTINLEKTLNQPQLNPSHENGIISYQPNQLIYYDKDVMFLHESATSVNLDIGRLHPQIAQSNIRGVLKDRQDHIWFATEFGVYRVKIKKSPFTNYLNSPVDEYNASTAFSTLGISSSDQEIWANGQNGDQFLINRANGTLKEISLKGVYTDPDSDVDPIVFYPILNTAKGEFLTTDISLIQYNNGQVSKAFHWKEGVRADKSWSIFKNENKIFLGLYEGGVGMVENDEIVRFDAYNGFETLRQSQTYGFLKWDEEHTLLATSSGIYVLNTKAGIVGRFWSGGKVDKNIPYNVIYHINRDKQDQSLLWVATAGGGLLKLQMAANGLSINSMEQFTVADGLSNDLLYAAYPDDYGYLWLPSNYGLMRFNIADNSVNGYTTSDGLPFNEFNRIAHHEAENGELIFGTMNGVTVFHPKDFLDSQKLFDVPLHTVQFKQFSAEANTLEDRTGDLLTIGKVILEPDDNLMIMNFALLEYEDISRVRYSYQLKGQSDDWIYLNGNELRLSGLAYGHYTLNIRAQGASGEFSSQQLSFPIHAKAPFYLQWWFIVLSVIVFFLSIFILFKYRTRSLRKRQKELEEEVDKRTAEIEKDKEVIETQAKELKNLDELKSRFFANVSHELRTPLTLIVAPVQEMLARAHLNEDLKSSLTLVNKNGRRLQGMVNEILDLSKFESGKMTIDTEPTQWYLFLKQLFASFDSLAKNNQIDYQFSFEGSKDTVVALDKSKVETVFNNLLSNACKFTPKQGKIVVDTGVNKECIWFQVSDTGKGISKEDLPHIFERYFQTKNKDQVAQGGTGIGLALTSELVSLLNGKIEVKSVPDVHTTFNVQLPVELTVMETISSPELIPELISASFDDQVSEVDTDVPDASKDTVLLVEDNPDLTLFVSSVLKPYYCVVTAANGQEALDMLEVNPDVKLIVSDVMMPIMDGFQLLDKLKSSQTYKMLPVIMLTARAALQDRLKALRIGVDDYLTKPFVKEELLARIDNLLQNAQGREEAKLLEPALTDEVTNDDETQKWLNKLEAIVLKNIELAEFTIDDIAEEMFTSKRQLYRLIKENVGVTPLQYVKDFKLSYARQLLEAKKVNAVKVAAYSIGYPNVVYFRREFKKAFGRNPSDYLE